MKLKLFIFSILLTCLACNDSVENGSETINSEAIGKQTFDEVKWKTKTGNDYPFREAMLEDVMNSKMIRALTMDELLALLGGPEKMNENHLYYRIDETRLGFWTLHTKTLVIKYTLDDTIEWMKIHE